MLPFEEEVIAKPESGASFFIRAQLSQKLTDSWKQSLICEQTKKSEFDLLAQAGCQTVQRIEGEFDMGLCLLTKHKKENYGNIARAWNHLNEGGTLVCAGSNKIGVKSFEKNVRKELPVCGNLHKNHCRVFWIEKGAEQKTIPEDWLAFGQPGKYIKETDYLTQPGMFCWEKVDRGSEFLAQYLPKKLKGPVADFGSGWGYLSCALLERYEDLDQVDLYEDEWLALEASRSNLNSLGFSGRANFHWFDLSGEPPKSDYYRWVVMNPPFHRSERTDVSLGIRFIENAARSLKRSGSLLLVANRQLPYERALEECFKRTERLAESVDYKVLLASTPLKR